MVRQKPKGSGNYYYQFMVDNKNYHGTCKGCTTKKSAEKYEREIRQTILKASSQKTVRALIENFRDELTGGTKIKLTEAFELSLQKPRKRIPNEKSLLRKREAFKDFVEFMQAIYPDIEDLASVQPRHAEAYIARVRTSGRFNPVITYVRGGQTLTRPSNTSISNKTINDIQTICQEVFDLLSRDAGILDNPFNMKKLEKDATEREAFSEQEICLIRDNLDSFTRPLFTLAMMTALREGDICTLKWDNIDFQEMVIRKKMNKTRHIVEIPIANDLCGYLRSLQEGNNSEYVLPVHAKMYLENPSGVSYRVKNFLERIGIQTTRKPEGRSRAISVKDLHSCRHTFCYYAGIRGIPLAVVQSIVGHMSPEMTKHYSAHATLEEKRKNIGLMSDFMEGSAMLSATEPERAELHRLADTLPLEQIKKLLIMLDAG